MNKVGIAAVILFVLFLGYLAIKIQVQGTKIVNLEADTTRLGDGLRIKTNASDYWKEQAGKFFADKATLSGENSQLREEKANAKADAASARAMAAAGLARVDIAMKQKTAAEKKVAADKVAGGVGVVPTTVEQTDLNSDIGIVKEKLLASESNADALTTENSGLRAENKTLKVMIQGQADQISDLETNLNGQRNRSANRTEKIGRHFLGIGLPKAITGAANDIRAGRAN